MEELPVPQDIFGVPLRQPRVDAERLLRVLADAWEAQYGRPLRDLESDFALMYQRLFKPVAREERLRNAVKQAVDACGNVELPGLVGVSTEAGQIVSPEGRVLIQLLEAALTEQDDEWCQLGMGDVLRGEHRLIAVYRQWARERLNRVVSLMSGDESPLLPAAIGLVVMLLLEGAIGADQGLLQRAPAAGHPAGDRTGHEIHEGSALANIEAIAAFADSLTPEHRWDRTNFSLYGGYAVSEARRRIGALQLSGSRARGDSGSSRRLFIRYGYELQVVGILARELHRREVSEEQLSRAMEAMLKAYLLHAAPTRVQAVTSQEPQVRRALIDALAALSKVPTSDATARSASH